MTAKRPEPKLHTIKVRGKPIKLFSTISLFGKKKLKMTPATKLWPEKDKEDDRLPES